MGFHTLSGLLHHAASQWTQKVAMGTGDRGIELSYGDVEALASQLARHLRRRARLSAFEVPKRFFFVAQLPRPAKGAGDRNKLAAMFG